jgi:glutamate-ammonia-ligase adenylyltransferase
MNEAWTWEHQALTRARWLAGDPRLGADFCRLRADVLGQAREPARLRRDVLTMRERIFASHGRVPPGLVDVKHSRGGIIDVEFAVQHTVLRHAARHPALLASTVSDRILAGAAELGLLPSTLADGAARAYRQYRLWMHAERLQGNERIRVPRDDAEPHRRATLALWEQVFEEGPLDGAAQFIDSDGR